MEVLQREKPRLELGKVVPEEGECLGERRGR
jgi:hypothetical protein